MPFYLVKGSSAANLGYTVEIIGALRPFVQSNNALGEVSVLLEKRIEGGCRNRSVLYIPFVTAGAVATGIIVTHVTSGSTRPSVSIP
jgi:hypothetical protein